MSPIVLGDFVGIMIFKKKIVSYCVKNLIQYTIKSFCQLSNVI